MDFGYQDEDIDRANHLPHVLLGHEPGLGKTRIALKSAQGRTLVIAPAISESVWLTEYGRWTPDADVTWVSYQSLCERTLNEKTGRRDRVVNRAWPEYRGHWDTVICDEAHNLKGRHTSWALAARGLKYDRLIMMSGTPIMNYANELWALSRMLWPDRESEFRGYWRWADYWFGTYATRWSQYNVSDNLRPEHTWADFYESNLGDRFIRRLRKDVLKDLPPVTETTLTLPMVPKQRAFYAALKKQYMAQIDGDEIRAWSSAGLHTQLHKASTGVGVVTGKADYSNKMDALKEILQDHGTGNPQVVFTWYRDTALRCAEIARGMGMRVALITGSFVGSDGNWAGRSRTGLVDGFQRGEFDVLVGTLGTISEAINLHRADQAIFVERSWRPSTNVQAIDRLRRIGQKNPVTVRWLISEKSVDSGMTPVLRHKTDQQVKALTAGEFKEII